MKGFHIIFLFSSFLAATHVNSNAVRSVGVKSLRMRYCTLTCTCTFTFLLAIAATGFYTGALKETEAFSWWKRFYPARGREGGGGQRRTHRHHDDDDDGPTMRRRNTSFLTFDHRGFHRNMERIPMAMAMDSGNRPSTNVTNIYTDIDTTAGNPAASLNSKDLASHKNLVLNIVDQSNDASVIKQNNIGNHNANELAITDTDSDTDIDNEPTKLAKTGMDMNETTLLHTFHCSAYNITLHSHGISLLQFKAWIHYKLKQHDTITDQKEIEAMNMMQYVTSKRIDASNTFVRNHLRKEWFARRLIVDRTEVLSKYPSDNDDEQDEVDAESRMSNDEGAIEIDGNGTGLKRGGFEDLLLGYVGRLVDILKDEMEDGSPTMKDCRGHGPISSFHLLEWLTANYGKDVTQRLIASNLQKLPLEEQNEALLHLLHWFRERFPYYHDRCEECGASYRADCLVRDANSATDSATDSDVANNNNSSNEDDDDPSVNGNSTTTSDGIEAIASNDSQSYEGSFLGYCYPEANELEGNAARTEIYQCHSCNCNTRFPRYNAVQQIVENKGRGRCGEYSILLYRILRSLGHQARWVVDWADHVWAECRIGGRWVHLDPCEAALDHPLLYEEWGKKQTYIIAFWTPLRLEMNGTSSEVLDQAKVVLPFPLVEDVTLGYTTDANTTLSRRRDMEEDSIQTIISRATHELLEKMKFEDL